MNKLFTIFILTVILFSCKTSYDKNFTMQCNQNNVKEDIEIINSEKQKYLDSVYSSVIEINSINEYTSFLKIFPEYSTLRLELISNTPWAAQNSLTAIP